MTDKMEFTILAEPGGRQYVVTALVDGDNAVMHCDCLAGKTGQICKHRRALLEDDDTVVIEEATHSTDQLREAIAHTAIGRAMERLKYSEELLARAHQLNSEEKSRLARLMNADHFEVDDISGLHEHGH